MPAARVGSSWKSTQQLRSEELDAISKAIEIMSSSSMQGHAEAHVPAFVKRGCALHKAGRVAARGGHATMVSCTGGGGPGTLGRCDRGVGPALRWPLSTLTFGSPSVGVLGPAAPSSVPTSRCFPFFW